MSAARSARTYDLVHLGPTGYTGAYTITAICEIFPTNLKWAVAGRTLSKLEATVEDLRKRFPDRTPPAIEVCQQVDNDMDKLAAKTRVMISTVGPFSRYGEPVIKACAAQGTGYVDATGEVPWVKTMIDKYHETAKANNAIIIPQCGFESAFSDILAYSLAARVRERFNSGTKAITSLLWELNSLPSGGTLATIFAIFELFPTRHVLNAMRPYALSPITRPRGSYPARGGLGLFTGMMHVPKLGLAVDSGLIMGVTNAAIVWRTWGLLQQAAGNEAAPSRKTRGSAAKEGLSYGHDFHYTEVRRAKSRIRGLLYHVAMSTLPVLFLIPPFRWLLKRLVFQPGQGPSPEATKNDHAELRAVAIPEGSAEEQRYLVGRARWDGSMYEVTGLLLATAAQVILQIYKERSGECEPSNEDAYARRERGGLLTPACLGASFVEGFKRSPKYQLDINEESS